PDVFNRYISNYIDCSNEPLYPFGFGLSYTTFEYSSLCLSDNTLKWDDTLKATVTVTNKGGYDAYEVVQLYLHDELASISRPVKELKGYKRVFLHRGESCDVTFEISRDMLGFYDRDLRYVCEPGDFKLMVGSNSRDVLESGFTLVR
ncbi:MAG: fibronectin type III-like domain-contianing protein, partial [Muribaculaceae bacterium]|nr:fibronectin type III-like domain-contianing protein [Muribaculaceae bacterium]